MDRHRWSIPGSGPGAVGTRRQVELQVCEGRFRVVVDGRNVPHRQDGEQLTFALGSMGCQLTPDQMAGYTLRVGGRSVPSLDSLIPAALDRGEPDDARPSLALPRGWIIALAAALLFIVAWKGARAVARPPAWQANWQVKEASDGLWSASMPGPVTERPLTLTVAGAPRVAKMSTAEVKGVASFSIAVVELDPSLTNADLASACLGALLSLVEDARTATGSIGQVTMSERASEVLPAPTCRSRGTIYRPLRPSDYLRDATSNYVDDAVVITRGDVVDGKLLVSIAIVAKAQAANPAVERFFAGIRVASGGKTAG